jgi:uncharacterized protein (TIGR03435 family)
MGRAAASAMCVLAVLPAARAQAFEAASIKLSAGSGRGGGRSGPAPGGERYQASNTFLRLLIAEAYRVRFDQVTGGPDWIDRDRFDINAKAERPSKNPELRVMLQHLLADRFQLRFHRETKTMPVYELTAEKTGAKLRPPEAPNADLAFEQSPGAPHEVKMKGRSVPMDYLAWRLSRVLDRPVADRTSIAGAYDFDLHFIEEVAPEIVERLSSTHPTIFEALRDQLGLRLESRRGPVEILVIDRAVRPEEN